jgi:hypothetical protein
LGCVEGDHLSTSFTPSSLELEGEEVATAADDISRLTGIIDVALSSAFPDENLKSLIKRGSKHQELIKTGVLHLQNPHWNNAY